MKEIKLTKGLVSLIDDEDFDNVSKYSWYAHEAPSGRIYAKTDGFVKTLGKKSWGMHRMLLNMKPNDKLDVDHIDRNGLNNQKSNLRKCTRSQNNANKLSFGSTSIYKGVYKRKLCNSWQSKISHGGDKYNLGSFKKETDAALAYNIAAVKLHGEFALLNNIKS